MEPKKSSLLCRNPGQARACPTAAGGNPTRPLTSEYFLVGSGCLFLSFSHDLRGLLLLKLTMCTEVAVRGPGWSKEDGLESQCIVPIWSLPV